MKQKPGGGGGGGGPGLLLLLLLFALSLRSLQGNFLIRVGSHFFWP